MNNLVDKSFIAANQAYLFASINLVREELEYFSSRKANNSRDNFQPSEKTIEAFKKAKGNLPATSRIDTLVQVFSLSSFERKILLMCVGVELKSDFGDLIASLHGNTKTKLVHPTFNLAVAAFPKECNWNAIDPGAPLRHWDLITIKSDKIIARSPMYISEHILHYLLGAHSINHQLTDSFKAIHHLVELPPSQKEVGNKIVQIFKSEIPKRKFPIVQLVGNKTKDIVDIAQWAMRKIGFQLYKISAAAISNNKQEVIQMLRLWNREARLKKYFLFIDCSNVEVHDRVGGQSLIRFVEGINGAFILSTQAGKSKLHQVIKSFHINNPTREEQFHLWQKHLGNQFENIDSYLRQLTAHFDLGKNTIIDITYDLGQHFSESEEQDFEKLLWTKCCEHTRPNVDELAHRIEAIATWDDIVLPKNQKETLWEIAKQVENRSKVYEEWGFGNKSSRGFGISVLFFGESGTGKTMAAEVLANELHLDLYRIDLSQVVNKYIGETEKNLKRIFDAAEAGGAILLFDEADALFGKRSEVKDSHDRHANIEVSYLLQRMENYRGLAILTTNMKNALDTAFLRRIRFVVNFPRPDTRQRREIWEKVFPKEAEVGELELDKLARLNIPGGNIKNVAMNAAFLAAANKEAINMDHILKATRGEYAKLEKTLSRGEVKDWAKKMIQNGR